MACRLFADLPEKFLRQITSFARIKNLKKGEYLFHQDDCTHGFYVVQSGSINIHRVNALGKEQVLHIFHKGDTFAEIILVSDDGYPADARADENSSVILIPKKEFLQLLRKHSELMLRIFVLMSKHLKELVGLVDDLTLKNVEARLIHRLLQECPKPLSEKRMVVELRSKKQTLAAEIGTTSETLSRTLSNLRAKKLIEVKGKKISILNPRLLQKFSQN
jgi:CRP/FNR family transcriptional regulator, dissimilatory nitrate respiration regulator